MTSRLPFWMLLGSAIVTGCISGCYCCSHRPCAPAVPACAPCTGGVAPGLPGPRPVVAPLVPQVPAAPGPVPTEVRSYAPTGAPPVSPSWQAAPSGPSVRLTVPTPASPPESARLKPPEPAAPAPLKPAVVEERPSSPSLPSGIAQFSKATEQVASGLKPDLEGLDWLQKNGYRTVLHLHAPGAGDADRGQIEKRELKYIGLILSPETLTQSKVDEFKRIVEDQSNYPLFVYDENGMLAGGLWYLYFRTVQQDSDESARKKAERLGLKDEHRAMWEAIQKLPRSALDK
jgi:hypothetical protein